MPCSDRSQPAPHPAFSAIPANPSGSTTRSVLGAVSVTSMGKLVPASGSSAMWVPVRLPRQNTLPAAMPSPSGPTQISSHPPPLREGVMRPVAAAP